MSYQQLTATVMFEAAEELKEVIVEREDEGLIEAFNCYALRFNEWKRSVDSFIDVDPGDEEQLGDADEHIIIEF